jgi:phosphatidylserine decarboxylase
MDTLFIFMQYLLPQHLLSRLTGWLADSRIPWLKNLLITRFAAHFQVDMSEAVEPDLRSYANFNAFFTRALRPDARPLASAGDALLSPADGAISQLGDITGGQLFQAKGHSYSVVDLLGGDQLRAADFLGGSFATVYLSPRDYHRVHMPLDGTLTAQTYVPGELFSVNQTTAENVPRLFARNERLICYFDTALGPVAVVMVGAMIVAGIETVWGGQVAPPSGPQTQRFDLQATPPALSRGAEMGRFQLGSTVILLLPEAAAEWHPDLQAGSTVRQGQSLANLNLP